MIKTKRVGGVRLFFDPGETETAEMIAAACEKALQLAHQSWGLEPPADCRVYVMTSWSRFFFQSAPWPWRVLLAATFPIWSFRARRTWPYSAAWTQRYGSRVAIGVKPPRLVEKSDRSIGVRMFVEERDQRLNVEQVTCHELVHACSAHLLLPMWLNEGIATLTADRFLGRPVIREDTVGFVRDFQPKGKPPTYRELLRMNVETIAYHSLRGYWIVRYLEHAQPGFLRELLSVRRDWRTIEAELARLLGIAPDDLWSKIDGMVAGHFEKA